MRRWNCRFRMRPYGAGVDFLALAIETADEERSDAWCVSETEQGLRLMTGRLLACEVARSKMRVSVIGPISDDVRATLGAKPRKTRSSRTSWGAATHVPHRARIEGSGLLEGWTQQLR